MMRNKPKVSLITVYYNRSDSVEDSINSLISQTYENIEIIIVDDFSTDTTFDELKRISNKNSRILLLRNHENIGFTHTLVNIIDSVDSKYIAIHGAGDISYHTRIEEQVEYLEKNPDVGVVTPGLFNEREHLLISKKNVEITTKDLLRRNYVTHGAVMFRLSDYNKAGGYRTYFTTRQDKDLMYRMSLITKIHFYPKKLYKIEKHDNSVTSNIKQNPIPLILSVFATSLIRERIEFGYDSLDIYRDKGALFFNPTKCNKYFIHFARVNSLSGNLEIAIAYIDILIKINVKDSP